MGLQDAVRQWKTAGLLPATAIQRLAWRLEKRAFDAGEFARDAGSGALEGGFSGAFSGALGGLFDLKKGGWKGVGQKAMVGGAIGAVPFAMFRMYGNYQQQKARDKAIADYQRRGGYGHEFHSSFAQPQPPR